MCLNAGAMGRQDSESETLIPVAGGDFDVAASREIAPSLTSNYGKQADSSDTALGPMLVTHSLRADGFDASEDGTGRGTPLVAVGFAQNQRDEVRAVAVAGALSAEPGMKQQTYIAFSAKDHGADAGELAPTLRAGGHSKSHANAGVMPAVAFGVDVYNGVETGDVAATLNAASGVPNHSGPKVQQASAVRRLTPRECERLQGFPDDYTLIPVRNKPAADGPRYKALGNSMAVPCMAWLGQRIALVEMIAAEALAA